MRECTLCYVVSENIFESNGILLANEISCVTLRCHRQMQTAVLGGAGPPGPQRSGNMVKTWPEGPGSGACSLLGPLASLSCKTSHKSSQHWGHIASLVERNFTRHLLSWSAKGSGYPLEGQEPAIPAAWGGTWKARIHCVEWGPWSPGALEAEVKVSLGPGGAWG